VTSAYPSIDFTGTENSIEIFSTSEDILNEILDNFDMVYATCSGSGAIIRPDAFNLPEREFGFTISNADQGDLPIIGIIDSGISNTTPLEPIIVNPGENFDLTQTPLILSTKCLVVGELEQSTVTVTFFGLIF
jgi:hypothetical protein